MKRQFSSKLNIPIVSPNDNVFYCWKINSTLDFPGGGPKHSDLENEIFKQRGMENTLYLGLIRFTLTPFQYDTTRDILARIGGMQITWSTHRTK